jgi:hypothetical protein
MRTIALSFCSERVVAKPDRTAFFGDYFDKTGISGSFDFEYKNEEADASAQVTRDDIDQAMSFLRR